MNNNIYNDFAYIYARQEKYHSYSKDLAHLIIDRMKHLGHWPKDVVDLACGVGIAAEIFANAGFDVTGIDKSDEMLNYAKQRSLENELGIKFYRQEIENLMLEKKVDLITCMYDSLNYITDETNFYRSMDNVISSLNESGWFVFDIATLHALSSKWVGVEILRNNKDFFEIHNATYDDTNGVNIKKISFYIGDNGTFRHLFETHIEKAHEPKKIEDYLLRRGMEIIDTFADTEYRPVDKECERIIYFARKISR